MKLDILAETKWRRVPLRKSLVLSLPAGTFVQSNCLASWSGKIAESREARLAQWNEIKAAKVDGRLAFIRVKGGKNSTLSRTLDHVFQNTS